MNPDDERRLRAAIARLPGPVFAVVDGAQFEDLPGWFGQHGLLARSLFLDQGDAAVRAAGPWLLELAQRADALDQVLGLVGDREASAFWSCADGQAALYRHLRTLNRVAIPHWAALGLDAKPADGPDGTEMVMFRHWDPSVLGATMPVLDAGQFARVLGPAQELLYVAADYGGLRRVVADGETIVPRGVLRLRDEQIEALLERRQAASTRRIVTIVRDAAPEETAGHSDAALTAEVTRLQADGSAMGLTTEHSHAWWCYLMLSTGGAIGQGRVRAYVSRGPGTADERLAKVRDTMLVVSQSDRGVG